MSTFNDLSEQEREDLYLSGVEQYPHLPDLAHRWLTELLKEGGLPKLSSTTVRSKGKPKTESTGTESSDPTIFSACLDNGQTIRVRLDESLSANGYATVEVEDRPSSETAILAALASLECEPVRIKDLEKILPYFVPAHHAGVQESLYDTFSKLVDEDADLAKTLMDEMRSARLNSRSVQFAVALLRYFRPDFDDTSPDIQRNLLKKCCERINKLIGATRQLAEFLEYGNPDKDQRPAVEDPHRDVEAAALRDIEGCTYSEIASYLEIQVSEKSKCVGDYSTVSKMVSRGRDILERAFGKDGWHKIAAAARKKLDQHRALSEREKFLTNRAEEWQISYQAVEELIVEGRQPTVEEVEKMKLAWWDLEYSRRFFDITTINGEPLKGY